MPFLKVVKMPFDVGDFQLSKSRLDPVIDMLRCVFVVYHYCTAHAVPYTRKCAQLSLDDLRMQTWHMVGRGTLQCVLCF